MNALRDQLKTLYAKYDIYIRPVLKFALALISFMVINNKLGYMELLNNLFILVILSLICAILPLNGTVIIGILLIIGHCFGLGLEVGAFALGLYILMLLLYFRFVPDHALVMLLTPVSFLLHAPLAVPLGLGLVGSVTSVLSSIFGVISWQFVNIVETEIAPMKDAADAAALDIVQAIPKSLFTREVILYVIVFAVVILVEATIRKLISDHSFEIAIGVGCGLYLFLMIAGIMILKVDISVAEVVLSTVISGVIGFVLEYFMLSVDYRGAEHIQFEDDHYYYYVKILPKTGKIHMEQEETAPEEPLQQTAVPEEPFDPGQTKVMDGPDYGKALEEALKNTNMKER